MRIFISLVTLLMGTCVCLDVQDDIELLMDELTSVRGHILRARSNFRRELRQLQNRMEVSLRHVVKEELSHIMRHNMSKIEDMDNFNSDGVEEIREQVLEVIDEQLKTGNIKAVVDKNIRNQLYRFNGQLQQLKTFLRHRPDVGEPRMRTSRADESLMHDGKIEELIEPVNQLKVQIESLIGENVQQREMLDDVIEAMSILKKKNLQQENTIGNLTEEVMDLKSVISSHSNDVYDSCPFGFEQHDDSCYWFSTLSATFAEATGLCWLFNSQLAHVETQEEHNFLKLRVLERRKGQHFLGASDMRSEGVWMWEQPPQRVNFTNWRRGEPNNEGGENCLAMDQSSQSKTWNDINCLSRSHFVCELQLKRHN